jgi:tetratricopeptide (TPR) repeat protein
MSLSCLQRSGFVYLLAIGLLPMAMSCSKNKADNEAKKVEPSNTSPVNPEANRLDKLIADTTEVIKKNPQQFNSRGELGYHKRGMAYAEKGEDNQAITDLTEAIRLYPIAKPPYLRARLVDAHNARAKCHEKKKENDKAISDYTEVIQLGTGGFSDLGETLAFAGFAANAHYKRGVLHDENGDHEKAVADYKEAARLAPELLTTNTDLKKRLGEQKP